MTLIPLAKTHDAGFTSPRARRCCRLRVVQLAQGLSAFVKRACQAMKSLVWDEYDRCNDAVEALLPMLGPRAPVHLDIEVGQLRALAEV
jgi:hypothetical protein